MVVLAESGPAGSNVPSGVAALLIATVPLLVVLLGVAVVVSTERVPGRRGIEPG